MAASGSFHTARKPTPTWLALAVMISAALACNFPLAATTPPEGEPRATEPPTPSSIPASPGTLPPSATTSPSPTDTTTPTATEGPPTFTASVNANCRTGPGTVYDVVRFLLPGATEEIVGKDISETWWVLEDGVRCWISTVTGTVSGDTAGVPVIPAPPTPTAVATSTYTPTPVLLVSSVSVTADATSYTGACPWRAYWHATASATGALTASWIWETSYNGTDWAETAWFGTVTFPGPGSQTVPDFWFQAVVDTVIYARVHITSPNSVYSNAVGVTINCTP